MSLKFLVTCGHLQRHIGRYEDEIRSHGIDVWVPKLESQQFNAAEMAAMLPEADVAVAGDDDLSAPVLRAAMTGKLKGLVRWGIGTDNVDKPVATELGLPVYNTPGMFSNEVADLALGHILTLARHLQKMDRDVRAGLWTRYEGTSLHGRTLGVVGLGGIGREIVRRGVAFGMKVIGSDVVTVDPSLMASVGGVQKPFETVIEEADIIVLACNLTAENHHLINAEALARMKDGVMLVNVARGPIVDEVALTEALKSGKVGSAGLDVFEQEPLPADSPLRQFTGNTLFGTHSGSSTAEAIQRVNRMSVDIALTMLGIGTAKLSSFNRVA
ncbi:dihydrofolate reductase [Kaistia algarum]|uniref:NAD(P)-dependent oxidoreductase n=1 Tax=Kaistia algarum TaxID=2083279 RepID=UPI000CE931CD|nr:NAD(P)-dependent oxidoreductase [Kaistia algarum]MCX5515488.1 phosphoglycerate dehydrogenase [Kaistia algarum]PPE78456.1 dihydrofolate reductase [Kaistia algarum]